jgi:hypothetical protein
MEFTVKMGGPMSEISPEFLQGMADRMSVSYHKYGKVADNVPAHTDVIENLKLRLKRYLDGDPARAVEAGNTEWLMDVANFAMIEFMHPAHPTAHFWSTNSSESPGLKIWGGDMVHDRPMDHE